MNLAVTMNPDRLSQAISTTKSPRRPSIATASRPATNDPSEGDGENAAATAPQSAGRSAAGTQDRPKNRRPLASRVRRGSAIGDVPNRPTPGEPDRRV